MTISKDSSPPRFAALRSRDFSLLWTGMLVSTVGSQMQLTAVNWHVFELLRGSTYTLHLFGGEFALSGEALGLGTLGLVRVIPIVLFALIGGVLADTLDRRRLLLVTQAAATLFAGILAYLSLRGEASVTAIYLLTAAGAAAAAFDNPARQALVPNLVPREHLTNAVSLNTLVWQIGSVIGPALAGLMVSAIDIGWVYAANAISFGAVILALLLMRYRGRAAANNTGLGWPAVAEGLHFTYSQRIIWGTMLLDFLATFFSSARTMLPIIASEVVHVGVQGYGLLSTAQSVGAIVAGAITSYRGEIKRQGHVLLVSVAIYGVATLFFGLAANFYLSYFLFALTGAADTVSTVIRGTIRQVLTPDHLRGRMTGVNMIFFMGGPQLGEMEAGLVASAFGVPFAIVSGGLATVLLTGWVAWRYPKLRAYEASHGIIT